MTDHFDPETAWPALFAPLTAEQRAATVNSLASSWHEGWVPNRPDVEDLTALYSGAIDTDEYTRRTHDQLNDFTRGQRQHTAPDPLK